MELLSRELSLLYMVKAIFGGGRIFVFLKRFLRIADFTFTYFLKCTKITLVILLKRSKPTFFFTQSLFILHNIVVKCVSYVINVTVLKT